MPRIQYAKSDVFLFLRKNKIEKTYYANIT